MVAVLLIATPKLDSFEDSGLLCLRLRIEPLDLNDVVYAFDGSLASRFKHLNDLNSQYGDKTKYQGKTITTYPILFY